ncbi:MAG: B12-binding domain-containing radical SAM protein [Deltaproteobacteria bacterium]|nr:B12-binding domain-containing radical SAM protein [Deltaproteobacteria bacterium]
MGLLYIGTVLKNAGYSVKIIDAHIKRWTNKKLLSKIHEINPDIIGITNMTSETLYMRRLVKEIKEQRPDCVIILGGPHISSFKRYEFENNPFVDYGVIGEGELSIIQLIRCIQEKCDPSKIKGIIFRKGDEIIETGEPEFIEDLDILPFPDFSLINIGDYFRHFGTTFNLVTATDRVYSLMYSRGCPFGCRFCHNIFGKRIRYFSADRIIEEIMYVKNHYGVKEIDFLDDTINANYKKTMALFERLIPLRRETIFAIPSGVRGDLFPDDLLNIMKEIGFFRINIAFESAVQRIINIANKNMHIEKTIENTYKLKKVSKLLGGFFMFGFPTETKSDIFKTMELMVNLPLHTATVSFVTPFPNTEFFNYALNLYSIEKIFAKLIKNDTFYSEPISLCEVSEKELMELKKVAIRRFYLQPLRIVMNIRDVPNYVSLIRNAFNVLRLSIFKNVPY